MLIMIFLILQALQGQGNFFPAYDKGSDIYDSLVLKLDGCNEYYYKVNLSNAGVIPPTTDDIMFGGDMQQWLLVG